MLDTIRTCVVCSATLELREFPVIKYYKSGKPVFRRKCSICYARLNNQKHREAYRKAAATSNARRRVEVTGLAPDEKKCQRCSMVRAMADFDRSLYRNRPRHVCRICMTDGGRKRELRRERDRRWLQKRRRQVIERLGGKCACCGEADYGFLAIDHTDGWGARHRRDTTGKNRSNGKWVIKQIIDLNYPLAKFRVLCHNCNMASSIYKVCPHTSFDVMTMIGGC